MEAEYTAREEEAVISSHVSQSNRHLPAPSAEDLVWADSCLINDPEHLNGDWNSVRFSLLEALDDKNKPCLLGSSSNRDSMDVFQSFNQTRGREPVDDPTVFPHHTDSEMMDYGCLIEDEADVLLSEILERTTSSMETCFQKSYLPNQCNAIEAGVRSDASSNTVFTIANAGANEDDDRDEFVKRLKKALAAVGRPNSLASVDDLVARVRLLSMRRISG